MRFIPTRVHGVIDYLWAVALAASPWILGFGSMWAEAMVPLFLGFFTIFYSLFTEYELAIRGVLPMRWHLWLDFATGLLLATSPWLFGFFREVWIPHVVFGLFAVTASLLTRTAPKWAAAPPEPFPA